MDAEARQQLSRFSDLKTEIDAAYESICHTPLAEALEPVPPDLSSVTSEQLDEALAAHNQHSERVDQLNVGDLGSLRSLAKAASGREMHSRDTDLVELTLATLFAFDKLRSLLRQRSIMLNLHSTRLQWEAQRATVQDEELSLRQDIAKFITKSRWCMPPDIATPKKRASSSVSLNKLSSSSKASPARQRQQHSLATSSSNSNLMARRMRSDILSLDVARFSQRLHSLLHVALKQTGKTLDHIIDLSPAQIPDPFLDVQEADEDRVAALNKGTVSFLQTLAQQWKVADEIAYAALDVRLISESTQREADSEILKLPTQESLDHYQSMLESHNATLTQLRRRIHDPASLPRPTHSIAPDQSEQNEQVVTTLEYLTGKSESALRLALDAVNRYAAALDVRSRATSVKEELDASLAMLQSLIRSMHGHLALVPQADATTTSVGNQQQLLQQSLKSMQTELSDAKDINSRGQVVLEQLYGVALDPNFTREVQTLLNYHEEECRRSEAVQQDIQQRLKDVQGIGEAGERSQQLLNDLQKAAEKVEQDLKISLWKEEWQKPEVQAVNLIREEEELRQTQETLAAVVDTARGCQWDGIQRSLERRATDCQEAFSYLQKLDNLRREASRQVCKVDEVLGAMRRYDDELQQLLDSTAPREPGALEQEVPAVLNGLHQAVPFLHGRSTATTTSNDLDLEAHDARVRKALNAASMQLNAQLERVSQHREHAKLQDHLQELQNETESLSSTVDDLIRIVERSASTIEGSTPETLGDSLGHLPPKARFEGIRQRSSSIKTRLTALCDPCSAFDDLQMHRQQAVSTLEQFGQRVNDSEQRSAEVYDTILRLLDQEEARKLQAERQASEEEVMQKQAMERFEVWHEEVSQLVTDLGKIDAALEGISGALEGDIRDEVLESLRQQSKSNARLFQDLSKSIGLAQTQLAELQERSATESRWPETAAADLSTTEARVGELQNRRNLLQERLEARRSELESRVQRVAEEARLSALKTAVDSVMALFSESSRGAHAALDQLATSLQSMPPLSDDPSEGQEALRVLDSTLMNAQEATRELKSAVSRAEESLPSDEEHEMICNARSTVLTAIAPHNERLGRLTASATSARDTWTQHLEDLERQAEASRESQQTTEREQVARQAKAAETKQRREALDGQLSRLSSTVAQLEEGLKHIEKQQRSRDQTAVLSRSLSASARTLQALSQSAMEDQQHLHRRLARFQKHASSSDDGVGDSREALVLISKRLDSAHAQLLHLEETPRNLSGNNPSSLALSNGGNASYVALASHDDVFGPSLNSANPVLPPPSGSVLKYKARFEELSTRLADLQRSPGRSDGNLFRHIQEDLEDLQDDLSHAHVQPDSEILSGMEHIAMALKHREHMDAFHRARTEAENNLSDLLDQIDAFDATLPKSHSTPTKARSAPRETALSDSLDLAKSSVLAASIASHSLSHVEAVKEAAERLHSTFTELQEMADEKLHPRPPGKTSEQMLFSPPPLSHTLHRNQQTPGRPDSRASVMSSATKASRIPRVKSSMHVRSSTSELPRPSSPSAFSIRSEAFASPRHTSQMRQPAGTRSYGTIATRRPRAPPASSTPARRIPTSSSTKSLKTPDLRQRTLSQRSLSSNSLLMATPEAATRQRSLSSRSLAESLKPHYTPASKRAVDQEVARVVNSLDFKQSLPIRSKSGDQYQDQSGRYFIGERLYFCRILRSRCVMIRVGGGWQELKGFLKAHFSHLLAGDPDGGDVSALVPHSPDTPRSASLSFTKSSDTSGDLLKFMSPTRKRESSPGLQVWR